jgi:ferredoxin
MRRITPGRVKDKMKDIKKEKISRRELLQKLSPLGRVSLDVAKCTGCKLCTQECPTGALSASSDEESDTFRLLFKHGVCVACGKCAEICPEKALEVERLLEPDKLDGQTVLFEDEIARCSRCGCVIGNRKMIDKLRARTAAAGHPVMEQFELCPKCKTQTQFGHITGDYGHIS